MSFQGVLISGAQLIGLVNFFNLYVKFLSFPLQSVDSYGGGYGGSRGGYGGGEGGTEVGEGGTEVEVAS